MTASIQLHEIANIPNVGGVDPDVANVLHHAQQSTTFVGRMAELAENEKIVGVVGGSLKKRKDKTTLWVEALIVDAFHRRQGIATAMVSQFVGSVIETYNDLQHIYVVATTQLTDLFLRCGFRVTRVVPTDQDRTAQFEFGLDVDALRQVPVVQVDAFTNEIFSGNPAGVVLLSRAKYTHPSVTEWMQNVAKEKNLAQTAFTTPHELLTVPDGDIVHYDLRWFTPTVEVPLCGHGTLSTAFVLYDGGHVPAKSTIHFHTRSGVLVCKREAPKWISMDFPLRELYPVTSKFPSGQLAKALGLVETDFIAIQQTQTSYVLVHISTETFESIIPNFQLLLDIDVIGVIVTARASSNDVDFQSRFFAPKIGVPEDPVTGSAHCVLAGYWSVVLQKPTLYAHQACPSRGGFMRLDVPADRSGRVVIKGEAIISCRGTLTAPGL